MSALAAEEVEVKAPPQPPAEKNAAAAEDDEDGDAEGGAEGVNVEEEVSTAIFKPLVTLEEIEVVSGEEGEDTLFKLRGKLYRYTETLLDKGTGKKQWIERGVGEIKLLK